MQEVNPEETSRAYAFRMWMKASMPMVTLFRRLDVTPLRRLSRRRGLKFNMLMCWCIGMAASEVPEFYMLPVGDRLMRYDTLAVSTIVANYLRLTAEVARRCANHDITDSMVIGTSALAAYDIDGAVGMYSGIFNNPFMIWGRWRRTLIRTRLTVSFQFHHTQMDGSHAARFLDILQRMIDSAGRFGYQK